jgi:uncharacterized protein YacL
LVTSYVRNNLKHPIEGNIEGRIKVKRRRGRRGKQLLDNLKKAKKYCKLKYEALDCSLGRTRFERSCGPVVRQTTE